MKYIIAWMILTMGGSTVQLQNFQIGKEADRQDETKAQASIMRWDFETVMDRAVIEASTNIADTIEGNFEWVQGVTGKGLRLDGFTTRVIRKGKDIVKPGAAFTIEAWVSLGEYPLNWCPVITT